jgi:predicted ATPase
MPKAIKEQIVAKADGVALFVEELTRTIIEGGQLKESGDRYEIFGTVAPLTVPSSLHASLVSRLDRLAPVREIAQIGAALGREFEFDLLASVTQYSRERLVVALSELHRAELIFPRGVAPQCTWVFKHALIQDAAYDTMLKSTRAKLHGRIADVLERDFPEFFERLPEVLAHHCAEAGQAAKAIEYYLLAARRATATSNNAEANAHLKKGLRLVEVIPDSSHLAARLRDRIMLSGWWWSP